MQLIYSSRSRAFPLRVKVAAVLLSSPIFPLQLALTTGGKSGELENCAMETGNIKLLLSYDDVMYQILLWLPVVSLLRFKRVCRSWHGLIESSYFIKKHLHLHHYDPSLKDGNQNLIYLLPSTDSSITVASTSIESFEELNVYLQLNCSVLHGYFDIGALETVSYNSIICLNLFNCEKENSICLWNPATRQSRVLPCSPSPDIFETTVGFGFDVKSNDYKVVNIIISHYHDEKRVEVYSLNTGSWRSATTVSPFSRFAGNPRMPFNNGTCFFWLVFKSSGDTWIFCFDFCSEIFRSISFPPAICVSEIVHVGVVGVKIACARTNGQLIETWVFNEYGTINESWAKLYTVDPYPTIDGALRIEWLSTNGNYIFLKRMERMCRLNVATKETDLRTLEMVEDLFRNFPGHRHILYWFFKEVLVEFKESLISIGEGISAAA